MTVSALIIYFSQVNIVVPIESNLDASWMWALNRYAFTRSFGVLFSFTYGPLGFLLCPQGSIWNVFFAFIANFLIGLGWVWVWLDVRKQMGQCGQVASWCALSLFLFPHDTMEPIWLSTCLLFSVWALGKVLLGFKCQLRWLAVASVLNAVMLFVKSSALTLLASHVLSVTGMICLSNRHMRRKVLAVAVIFFFLTYLSVALLFFDSLSVYFSWLKSAAATASGYNLHMVLEKSWIELAFPPVSLCLFLCAFKRDLTRKGWVLLFVMMPFFYGFLKYGWCRQSFVYFFAALAGLGSLPILFVERRKTAVWIFLICLNLLVSVSYTIFDSTLNGRKHESFIGVNPLKALKSSMAIIDFERKMGPNRQELCRYRLSKDWRETIGRQSMTQIPFSFVTAMIDDSLAFRPIPSLQIYSGCCPYLDGLNANFFTSDRAPRYIVCDLELSELCFFANYPRTWKAILSHYEYIGEECDRILLRRRECPIPLPCEGTLCGVVKQTLFGKFASMFSRNTVGTLHVRAVDGKEKSFQAVSENLNEPFPSQCLPLDAGDMRDILMGKYKRPGSIQCEIDFETTGFYRVDGRIR